MYVLHNNYFQFGSIPFRVLYLPLQECSLKETVPIAEDVACHGVVPYNVLLHLTRVPHPQWVTVLVAYPRTKVLAPRTEKFTEGYGGFTRYPSKLSPTNTEKLWGTLINWDSTRAAMTWLNLMSHVM